MARNGASPPSSSTPSEVFITPLPGDVSTFESPLGPSGYSIVLTGASAGTRVTIEPREAGEVPTITSNVPATLTTQRSMSGRVKLIFAEHRPIETASGMRDIVVGLPPNAGLSFKGWASVLLERDVSAKRVQGTVAHGEHFAVKEDVDAPMTLLVERGFGLGAGDREVSVDVAMDPFIVNAGDSQSLKELIIDVTDMAVAGRTLTEKALESLGSTSGSHRTKHAS